MKKYIFILALVSFFIQPVVAQINGSCIGTQNQIEWLLYQNIPGSSLNWLYYQGEYPNSPNQVKYLNAFSTTLNYTDNYASLIRGYIKAPETGNYRFNVTGDDHCVFYLSSDSTQTGLDTVCYINGYTGRTEYDKYPEQTSDLVPLVAGEYYYFEAITKEGGGGDHLQMHWRLPSEINNTAWTIIYGEHLYSYDCGTGCLPKNTPCDDGDPNTLNDMEDGHCNCYGLPETLPDCVGEQGKLMAAYYNDVSGFYVSDLYNAPKHPDQPDETQFIDDLDYGYFMAADRDSFGMEIKAMLYAPVTGDYYFNVTGYRQVILKLSTSTDPALATDISYMTWAWVGEFDHTTNTTQTSAAIPLVAGNFYYLNLSYKNPDDDNYGRYAAFWKTPFQEGDDWHFIDDHYLYGYACETICPPMGTACNDNDPMTFADKYDDNCNCIGVPCSDPACSNDINYTPYDECALTEEHSTGEVDSWLSCEPKANPNPVRGVSHWIQYDFGAPYLLDNAQIWNYNVNGATGLGFQEVVIDYSVDGTSWSTLGTFNWPQASGQPNYAGFEFPDFSGIAAQYVLITSLSNFDESSCMGISEISFDATTCPAVGTPCDDGNPETPVDAYNEYCVCSGAPAAIQECTDVSMVINDLPVATSTYDVIETIESAGRIDDGTIVNYIAGISILLNPEFEVRLGADFLADIIPCTPQSIQSRHSGKKALETSLDLAYSDGKQVAHILYELESAGLVQLDLYTVSGKRLASLVNEKHASGSFKLNIPVYDLTSGVYYFKMHTGDITLTEKLFL